jgi:hypothetical protein
VKIEISDLEKYMTRYVPAYRAEYSRLVMTPPGGGGYPELAISPYIYADEIICYLADDGVAVFEGSREPNYSWWIAGGPALISDFPATRTPTWVTNLLKAEGILGKDIGMYRVVAQEGIPDPIWRGELEPIAEECTATIAQTKLILRRVDLTLNEVLRRMTFGAFGLIIDIHMPKPEDAFWVPHVIRQTGFLPADRQHRRFINYLEVSPHLDPAAWDVRSIRTRVQVDVRRDFGWAFSLPERPGGMISMGGTAWVQPYFDRLSRLGVAIDKFVALLERGHDEYEAVFHAFLQQNSILLDVYGEAISKPRFVYPEGESPLGKAYVEPDFIIRYPGNSYKLVELERPSKGSLRQTVNPEQQLPMRLFKSLNGGASSPTTTR